MAQQSPQKGSHNTPTSTPAKTKSKTASRLHELRIKNARHVHKAHGDAEEIRQEGLSAYSALSKVRKRANETAHEK